ncbi:putative TRAPP II complex, Trs120 protein [Plasmopara halstedii]
MSSLALPLRWTRPAQFLVYLVPVGGIPSDLFASYVRLLQNHRELPLRSLTRPGGYAAELSPFRGLDWTGAGSLRFRFVSTAECIESCDGEDVHACNRVIGALGICHSPSLTLSGGLRAAHAHFEASLRSFPGLLMHKLFAFEHTFENVTASECEGLTDLVMFPAHHELQGTGESTVSLHLQVVMDTLAVNILMALEGAIRSATSSANTSVMTKGGDLASVLLDVNINSHANDQTVSSPLVLSRDLDNDISFNFPTLSPTSRSTLSSGTSFSSLSSSLTLDPRNRQRKRHLARREKLLGDYSVLVSCVSAAMDHYSVAIDMLRDEERRSGGGAVDALWLASALEGYVYCLYTETPEKLSPELIDKASDAIGFYAKAGTIELESLLIENMGRYYASVALATLTRTAMTGTAKLKESVWSKQLIWEVVERGLMLLPELQSQRQVEFLIQIAGILDAVGHSRRVAFCLHEAAIILLTRNAPSVEAQSRLLVSPLTVTKEPQRQRDLEAALLLDRMAADYLGIKDSNDHQNDLPWEVTTLYRGEWGRHASQGSVQCHSWLIIRFHVLRQLLTIARMLGDAFLVGTYCLQLLKMLIWCDSIAQPPTIKKILPSRGPSLLVDHLQQPFTSLRVPLSSVERATIGLHAKCGVYYSPPPGVDTKVRRNFIASPSATMSNAAASLSTTLTNTPRLLATPRQQFSAAVNALSTKASPAFTPFAHAHSQMNGAKTSRASGIDDRITIPKIGNSIDTRDFAMSGDSGLQDVQTWNAKESESGNKLDGAEYLTVWNLRSRSEITKIESRILNILESDCTPLRSHGQKLLPTFLQIESLKLRSSCNMQLPFFSRKTALDIFGLHSTCHQQSVKSDFFYSPFAKQNRKWETDNSRQSRSVIECDDAPAIYERGFPVHERLELQLKISNPLGVAIKLQEVKIWVTYNSDSSTISEKDEGIECYSCCFTLESYQKHKTVVLGIQPMRVGTFHVRGCFIQTLNIKTVFQLRDPVSIRVVGELPIISLSLRDNSPMALFDGTKAWTPRTPEHAKVQLAMFVSETRRCVLRLRCTGNRQVTNYRLAVSVQHRLAVKKTCVLFNNLPSALTAANDMMQGSCVINNGTKIDKQIGTKMLILRCSDFLTSPLPLKHGDCMTISFDLTLRGIYEQQEQLNDGVKIEWSVVYADETSTLMDETFYRETKLMLQLVPLPALQLQSVTLLPCGSEQIPIKCRAPQHHRNGFEETTDHLYFGIVINVTNPTNTTFKFRIRNKFGSSSEVACEAKIGQQCSRRFVVEVSRIQRFDFDEKDFNPVDVLNSLLEIEWETHYGARGRLILGEKHLKSIVQLEQLKQELLSPPIRFTIQPSRKVPTVSMADEGHNGYTSKSKHGTERILSRLSSKFFHMTNYPVRYRNVEVRLFEYAPIAILIEPASGNVEHLISGVEVEVTISEEETEFCVEISDSVMVVGLLKTLLKWTNPMDASPKIHEIQCMFLSEGAFRITVCGRMLDVGGKQVGSKIWSHQPLHVRVRSEDALASAI